MARSIAPPADLVSPPDDLVSASGPPRDLIQPPPDLVGTSAAPAETSLWRDVPGSLVAGTGNVLALPGQLYGLATGDYDTALLRGPQALTEAGRAMMSPGLRQKQAQVQALIQEAEKQGLGAEVLATLKGYLTDPYMLANFTVEQLPSLVGSLGAGTLAKLGIKVGARTLGREAGEQALMRAGQTGAVGGGAAMQGGQVGQQTYDEIMGLDDKIWAESPEFNKLIQSGLTPEEAKKQVANSGARLAAVEGAGISAATGAVGGAEKAAFSVPLRQGIIRRVLGTAAKEAAQEAAEEAGGQFAQNVAVQEIDPTKSLTAGVGSQGTMGALGGIGPGAVVGAAHGAPEVAPVEREVARVEPPRNAPDVNEPLGLRTESGVMPVRVLEYLDQDGQIFARIAEETADGARMESAQVVPLDDLLANATEAPEIGGRERVGVEPVQQEDIVADAAAADEAQQLARETKRERERGPELEVATPQQAPRLESLPVEELESRIASLDAVNRRMAQDDTAAVDNLTRVYGMSPEDARASIDRDIASRARRIAAMRGELDRRGSTTTLAQEMEPDATAGLTPLLRARPEPSEADTGSLTRPRPKSQPAQGELKPVAQSEADTGSLTRPKPRAAPADLLTQPRVAQPAERAVRPPGSQKPTTLLGVIRSMGIKATDKNAADLVESLGYAVRRDKNGNLVAANLPGLIRKNGSSVDEIRRAAEEMGIIGRGGGQYGETEIQDLLDAAGNARKAVAKTDINDALEQREAERNAALEDKYGAEPTAEIVEPNDALSVTENMDAKQQAAVEEFVDPDDPSTYMDYEPMSREDMEALWQEAESARQAGESEAAPREGAAESAVDQGRAGPSGVEPGETTEGARPAGEAEAARGAGEEGGGRGEPQFERVANVEGATEQGVVPGAEQAPEESQAARERAADKTAEEIERLRGQQSKIRSNKPQREAGGMFGGDEKPPELFERPRRYRSRREQRPAAEIAAQTEAVKQAVRDIAGPDAKVEIVDNIIDEQGNVRPEATGRYDYIKKVIYVATHSPDMVGTARHEVVHMLRDLGVIKAPEWSVLETHAKNDWRKKFDIDRKYTAEDVLLDGEKVTPEMLEDVRNEEGVAAAYAAWLRGDLSLTGRIKAMFERIKAFFDLLAARIKNDPITARMVFRDLDAGRYAPFATKALREHFSDAVTGMNAATAQMTGDGEQAVGNRVVPKEARSVDKFNRLPPEQKQGPRWLSWPTRMLSFPLARAATDPMFAAYTNAELSRQKRESAVTRMIQSGVEPIFKLPVKEQNEVRKALELVALNNAWPSVVNGRMTLQNNTSKIARLTGPKRIVRLSPEATKAMLSYKQAMDNAWQAYGEAAVKRVTRYDGDMTPQAARAKAQQYRAEGKPRDAKDASMAADILDAVDGKKRQGYYPAMRDGDTQVIVRRKTTPEFARIIGMARARGYPRGEPVTSEGLDRFLNAAEKPRDVEFWSELKHDYDAERAKAGNVAPPEDEMIWNEHFHVKPPYMGEVIPVTEQVRKRRTDAKIAEVTDLMRKRGVDMSQYEVVTRPVKDSLKDMMNDQSVPVLEKLVRMATAGDPEQFATLWNGISDQIGKEMASSFRKRSNVVPGFSMDIADTLSRYSHAVGNVAARLEYKNDIDEALDAIKSNHPDPGMRGETGYAARLKEYVDNPSQDYNALKTFGFMYYLAGVPSTAFQNITQVPMISAPMMTGIFGVRGTNIIQQAWGAAARAVRVGKNGPYLDVNKIVATPQEKQFLKKADESGLLTATVTREILGIDRDSAPEMQAAQTFWGKVKSVGGSMFEAAESLNRATALLAGYRAAQMPGAQEKLRKVYGQNENFKALANRNGTIDPEAFGEFFSREVNFEGSRVNRPEALRGLGGVLLQFKSYPMNYISLMRRAATQMGPEGKVAVALMVGMMLMGGGLLGLPFAEDATDLYDNIAKIFGDDPQTVHTLQAAMADHGLGKLGAEAVLRGVSRQATGLDLSRSIGMGNVAPRMDNPLQMLGPTPAAIAGGLYYGWQRLEGGQSPAAAAMELAPRALKGPIQATSVLPEEGLVSRSNRQIIPPSQITPGQRVARSMGFQPAEFSREYERRAYARDVSAEANREATALRGQYQRLLALAYDKRQSGKDTEADALLDRARRVAERMGEKGIKVPTGRDAMGPNVRPDAAALRQAPKRARGKMSENPYPDRE